MSAVTARRRTVLWVILIASAAVLYGRGLDRYQIDDDEEGYAYAAWRTSQSDIPYRDFLTPQLPAFLYPGAVVTRFAGRDLGALRAWSVVLVLVAGGAVFATGRSLLGTLGGVLAAALFLATGEVFSVGRAFRPEATMLAATTAATAILVTAEASGKRVGTAYAIASLLFALGLLAKLFAALPWAAAIAYVAWETLRRRRTLRRFARDSLLLTVPGLLLVGAVMGTFVLLAPQTLDAVLGHHLRQGAGLGWTAVVAKTLVFFRSALERNAILLVFVPAGVAGLLAVGGSRAGLVVWQLPTVLALFFLTRDLYHRHMVVLFPALALCAAGALVWFARAAGQSRRAVLATASVAGALFLALATDALGSVRTAELGTAAVGAVARALVPPGGLLLSDTPGPAFHAGRATLPTAAGLSGGAALSGQITGAQLLSEMSDSHLLSEMSDPHLPGVELVLIDASPAAGHLRLLGDYASFERSLNAAFERSLNGDREPQGGAEPEVDSTSPSAESPAESDGTSPPAESPAESDATSPPAESPAGSDATSPLSESPAESEGASRPVVSPQNFERIGFVRRAHLLYDVYRRRETPSAARIGGMDLLAARVSADGPLAPRRDGARPATTVQLSRPILTNAEAMAAPDIDPPVSRVVDIAWLVRGQTAAGDEAASAVGAASAAGDQSALSNRSAPTPAPAAAFGVLPLGGSPRVRWRALCQDDLTCAEGTSPLVDVSGRPPDNWESGEVLGSSYRLLLPGGVASPYRLQMAVDLAGVAEGAWVDVE